MPTASLCQRQRSNVKLLALINLVSVLNCRSCSAWSHFLTAAASRRDAVSLIVSVPAIISGTSTPTPISSTSSHTTQKDLSDGLSTTKLISSDDNFVTTAFGKQEYTNAITASRDTNISPAEAYDTILQCIPSVVQPSNTQGKRDSAVLDVGAGAGLSTAILWQKGYRDIDAVDWSRTAWDECIVKKPHTVKFYAMDDQLFFQQSNKRYDIIVYNFAINIDKAIYVARNHLVYDPTSEVRAAEAEKTASSLLLAPVNDKRDYWYKQRYMLFDSRGTVLWQSDDSIGAWSVQFQPDVTSSTCTGSIWCGPFNDYHPLVAPELLSSTN